MGRSFNLLAAAFLYMLYNNCLNIVQSMIAQGKLDFWIGLALPHVIAVALVMLMFGRQLRPFGLVGRRRTAPASA
jgi:lipopolysaccharide export system permease protein